MELLLKELNRIDEYRTVLDSIQNNHSCAISGVGQVNRSHIIASLYQNTDRPILVISQDDSAAKRLHEDLKCLLDSSFPVLPSRELTFYDNAAVSRGWEHKRLRQLYDLSQGVTKLQIVTWDSLSQRTIPNKLLSAAVFSLTVGNEYPPQQLTEKLAALGYSRCDMVEGPGQFALRGDILDLFSPADDRPCRAEFFGDELDTMGYFDPVTQRRTENINQITILPVSETQPRLHPGNIDGLCKDIANLLQRQKRRKNVNESLITTLERDLERLINGISISAADRYMALIYPEMTTAMDYLPSNTIIILCDQGSIRRRAHSRTDEIGMQLDSMLQGGIVAGELCDYVWDWESFCFSLKDQPVLYLDSFGSGSYPEENRPKQLIHITAKQLPGYAGNLDTAASDLAHYQKQDFSCLVLCGSRHRAELMQQMLRDRNLSSFLCIPLTNMPKPGQILLSDGTLPYGMEYPDIKLAVLTEGQLINRPQPKRKIKKDVTNRKKLNSFTDLSPGDLVVHENYGIGRFVSMERIKVDNVIKDYIKIAYQGSDTLFVPATQLDMVSKYIGGGSDDPNIKLSKIGTDTWQKTKAKARKAAKDMAGELIKLYAARKRQEGFAFAADCAWQKEFEDSFPYPETEDQLRCIAEIKSDMEAPHGPVTLRRCGLRENRGSTPSCYESHHGWKTSCNSCSYHCPCSTALSHCNLPL